MGLSTRRRDLFIDQSTQDPDDPEISLLSKEKKATIEAIEKLNYRLTPADLASNTGLSLNQSSFWLNRVAGETRGTLKVTAEGGVIYEFNRSFKDAYLQRGLRKTLLSVGLFLFNFLYWIIRVSFGVALILSVLIVIVLIVLALVAMFSDSNGGGGGGDSGGGGDIGFFDINFLGDLFNWNYSPSSTYYPNSVQTTKKKKYEKFKDEHPKGNFFLECFSFLFGDGAPNSNLQTVRWQQIARVISKNGGVVSTEQLAPYLDGDRSDSGMIMTALAQFNGRPVVTKSGFIVYVFPDFLDEKNSPILPQMRYEEYLKEDHWRFSAAPTSTWVGVTLLAIFNFAGSWWLFKHIATVALLHQVALLIDVLLSYAVVFLLIPIVRAIVIWFLNRRIDERNEKRQKAFELVKNPKGDVYDELIEALEVRDNECALLSGNGNQVIYTSDKDLLEQSFEEIERK